MFEYKPSTNPVSPTTWEDYLKSANLEWKHILSSSVDEKPIQKFLEANPSIIPGAHGISLTSGHMPIYGAVFSQPELPGFRSKFPDFMWIAANSVEINPILIEIEPLRKKWFREDGQQTAEFTQAENQLNEWRIWFSNDNNKMQFRDLYLRDFHFRDDIINPHYVLIFGREVDVEPYKKTRSVSMKNDETHMTYDRLKFSYDQSDYITVKMTKKGVYAITMPPTCMISPDIIGYWSHIKNLPNFFLDSPSLSQERKEFLIERFNYGLKWLHSKDLTSHTWGLRE